MAGSTTPEDRMAACKKLDAARVEEKLHEFHGNFAAVARAFGVVRQTVQSFVSRRPALQAVAQDCREAMKDNAESALYKAVLEGQAWAVCFYLKTQAKDRGYIERQEIREINDEELDSAIEEELLKFSQPANVNWRHDGGDHTAAANGATVPA
jgi:hypothetical protein